MPRLGEILDITHEWEYLSVLDVKSGYNNIQIEPGSRHLTAFNTHQGMYQPTVMFFGLCNSPATFQAFMDDAFRDMLLGKRAVIYMDDILIGGQTEQEAKDNLREAIDICDRKDLLLALKKAQIFQ